MARSEGWRLGFELGSEEDGVDEEEEGESGEWWWSPPSPSPTSLSRSPMHSSGPPIPFISIDRSSSINIKFVFSRFLLQGSIWMYFQQNVDKNYSIIPKLVIVFVLSLK